MSRESKEIYEFGPYRLNVRERTFKRPDGERTGSLTEKAFQTLVFLVRNPGHLVTKKELLSSVWPDAIVEENNIDKAIHVIRHALNETPDDCRYIETVRKHGYRFIAKVRLLEGADGEGSNQSPEHAEKKIRLSADSSAPSPSSPGFRAPSSPKAAVVALAEWREEHKTEESASVRSNRNPASIELVPASPLVRRRSINYFYISAGLLLLAALVGYAFSPGAWFTRGKGSANDSPLLAPAFSAEKLTTNGKVAHAVISPDGKNVVFTNGIFDKQSLWLRQLDSASNFEIVAPSDQRYGGTTFGPDGDFVYFSRGERDKPLDIYRIPVFGGIPVKVVSDVHSQMSVSPDNSRIAFVRCNGQGDEYCSLWIAGTDGTNETKLLSRPRPISIRAPTISPDGKTIAFSVGQSMNGSNDFGLAEVNIETGVERELSAEKFNNIRTTAWLADQSGFLISAIRVPDVNYRLWEVAVATGNAKPLTKDSEAYSALRLDKTGDVMVAIETIAEFNLVLHDRDNPSQRRVLANAKDVSFTPDGKIVYSSPMSGNDEIWSINADGGEQKQLTNNAAQDTAPISSRDGNAVFFTSNRSGVAHVWRMNADGSNQAQITVKEGGFPIFISPDGAWVYYLHGLQRTLWRVAAVGGGDEQMVLNKPKNFFAISPDGLQVAFSERRGEVESLAIVSLSDGRSIKTIDYPEQNTVLRQLDWLPDGKNLAYVLSKNESNTNTLWLHPLNTEIPRKITDFGDDGVLSLAFSPDRKSYAAVQGAWKHDAVLLKGLR